MKAVAYGPSDLVSDLLALIEKRWVAVHDFERLLGVLHVEHAAQRIHCLYELKRIIRLLPLQVFSDSEQRENLLTVCQMAMDQAIDDEEAGATQVSRSEHGPLR